MLSLLSHVPILLNYCVAYLCQQKCKFVYRTVGPTVLCLFYYEKMNLCKSFCHDDNNIYFVFARYISSWRLFSLAVIKVLYTVRIYLTELLFDVINHVCQYWFKQNLEVPFACNGNSGRTPYLTAIFINHCFSDVKSNIKVHCNLQYQYCCN